MEIKVVSTLAKEFNNEIYDEYETNKEMCRCYEWFFGVYQLTVRQLNSIYPLSNKLKRRIFGVYRRRNASLKLLLSDIMKQIKKCATTIEYL